MPIRLLSPEVSSKIAAGEIVERPASVVKELVENSLDARATEISVEISGGGIDYIRIADNGAGIPRDEVELAFQRFATSKLSGARELEAIKTLGFRGEALPSIAAVSSVSLITRSAGEEVGTLAEEADGGGLRVRPEGASRGTSVTVRSLFRNFPARRKFLRTPATEASRIQALLTRYLLAYPAVRIQLKADGSTALSSSGSGDLREAISDVYGTQTAESMLDLISATDGDETGADAVALGMIGPSSLSRANRSHISIFVNGRWVQDRMLGYALEEAYRGFLIERRYPVAVVSLAVPYEEVDVNVHPSKTEVRFRHQGQVFSVVQRAVRHTLTTHSPVPEIGTSPVSTHPEATRARAGVFWPRAVGGTSMKSERPPSSPGHDSHPGDLEAPISSEMPGPVVPGEALPALRVLGQVQSTYIVAEGPDGVYLIDQHAAHERVLFERSRTDTASRTPQVQGLIEPATVELDPKQAEMVDSRMDVLARSGFQVENFGTRTYILRGIPRLLSGGEPGRMFVDVLELMAEGGGFETWEERAAYSIACHGAIRAGKTLTHQEMAELTRILETCQQPHTCPHGRPTMIHLNSARLEREFGRR